MAQTRQKSKLIVFIIYSLIWLAAVSIGLYFRLYPLHSQSSRTASEKATVLVLSKLKNQVRKEVYRSHHGLPRHQKDALVKKMFDELVHKEGARVRYTIDQVTQNIERDTEQGLVPKERSFPYLLASDSFYYYALTENISRTGKISDTVKGSKYLNPLMLAPQGHWEPLNLHPYVGYFTYRILKIFHPQIHLMHAVSFTPLLITALSCIPFLFILYILRCRPILSFIGAVFFLLAPIFIKRSTFGWYDNDPYNALFPLMILASVFYGLKHIHSRNRAVITGCITSVLIMLYALFWQGWVFLFSIIFVSMVLILLYSHFILKDKTTFNHSLIYFGIIHIGSFLLVSILFGLSEFFVLFEEGWRALRNFMTPELSPWPDMYIGVSELRQGSLSYIMEFAGGAFFFVVAIGGLILSVVHAIYRPKETNPFVMIIICVFLTVSFIITSGAQRFVMLCLIPLSLIFPLGLNQAYNLLLKTCDRLWPKHADRKIILSITLSVLMLSSIFIPIKSIDTSIRGLLNPIFNETWERALTQIDEKTPKESIINTWWSPGHFIKAMAHRAITFDGATINFPQAYWMANVLLSPTEEEALGLLRMLNNSANQAVEFLQSLGFRLSASVATIKEITKLDNVRARILLSQYIERNQLIDHLLALTHKRPPPSYLLIYNEMIEKNLQLHFVGNWNFKRIEEINRNPRLLSEVPNRKTKEYVRFLWSLIGGPYKYSGLLTQLSHIDDFVLFEEDVRIHLPTMSCHINSPKYGEGVPFSIFYLKDNEIVEQKLDGATLFYSVMFFENRTNYNVVLLDRKLAQSLLMRLFFFKGAGMKYFKPVIHESDLTKRTEIYVFEIDWDKFLKDLNRK